MELVPPKLPKKFLGLQVTPASGCFGNFLPLQSGIIMIAMIDIIAGLIFESVKLLYAFSLFVLTGYLGAIPADISACSPLFAIVGIFGIRNLDTEKLHFYSLFKQIEFVVRSVNLLIMGLSLTPVIFVLFIAYCAYSGYCAYIVWSTYELVKSEEGMLVKHGQATSSQGPSLPSY